MVSTLADLQNYSCEQPPSVIAMPIERKRAGKAQSKGHKIRVIKHTTTYIYHPGIIYFLSEVARAKRRP
jgi:hypothetical protein